MEQARVKINDHETGEVFIATTGLRWGVENALQQLYQNDRTGEFIWRDVEREESIMSEAD